MCIRDRGSAYDLFLSRELQQAEIVRSVSSQAVVDLFVAQGLEVAACIKQQLLADARRLPGLRLLPGRFMVIPQAMGVARQRGDAAAACLRQFVGAMKASGFVSESLARHRIEGASLAPVSYTHLDVYKRQVLRCIDPLAQSTSAPGSSAPSHRLFEPRRNQGGTDRC